MREKNAYWICHGLNKVRMLFVIWYSGIKYWRRKLLLFKSGVISCQIWRLVCWAVQRWDDKAGRNVRNLHPPHRWCRWWRFYLPPSFVFFSVIRLYRNEAVGEEEGNYVFKMSSAPLWKGFFFFFFNVTVETLLGNGPDYSPQGWLLSVIADWGPV